MKPFACMLARDAAGAGMEFPLAVEPKIDGVRAVVLCCGSRADLVTRNGKSLNHLEHIRETLHQGCEAGHVFDGELYDGVSFETTSSRVKSLHEDRSRGLRFHVFDALTMEEWIGRSCGVPYAGRKERMQQTCRARTVVHVPWRAARDMDEFLKEYHAARRAGYEGLMTKGLDSRYEWKRSASWLKHKDILTFDAVVTGMEEGEGRHRGTLGALRVSGAHEGRRVECRVGTGFTDAQRREFWNLRESLAGEMVEVRCQELTEDGSARFPVFLRLRPDRANREDVA